MTAAELRRRVPSEILRTPERIGFHMFICVTDGDFQHRVDADVFACGTGSFLTLRPGQVQLYDANHPWQGWIMMFRPQFLLPDKGYTSIDDRAVFRNLEAMPTFLNLQAAELLAVSETMNRMFQDAYAPNLREERHALLKMELQALLVRLNLIQRGQDLLRANLSGDLRRFIDFREAVEVHYKRWHGLRDYALLLKCSEKSLSRATQAMVGIGGKAFIKQRLIAEAKRLLQHTAMTVAQVSDDLGFDEPTNFGKFFLQMEHLTPSAFRGRI